MSKDLNGGETAESACQDKDRGERIDIHAFAMPHFAKVGGPAVHMTLRGGGLMVSHLIPLDAARKAHTRLGVALETFAAAEAMACGKAAPDQTATSPLYSHYRDQERRYRAKLAVRLGLAENDIRAVFDLGEDELAALRSEVAGS